MLTHSTGVAPGKCFPPRAVAHARCGLLHHSFHPYLLQHFEHYLKLMTIGGLVSVALSRTKNIFWMGGR